MTIENTPLLNNDHDVRTYHDDERASEALKHEALYNRFTPWRKKTIVALVSWSGLVPFFVSGTFIPSIPQIARDLESTGEVISLAVSLSIFAAGIGSLFWATYSEFYGRRPIYLCGLPLLAVGSLAVGLSHSIPQLMTWRVLQAFGSSGGLSVGAAVIGDIYKLEERGTAMGIFFGAMLLGPALAPLAGGLAAHYASWRVMQYILCASGITAWTLMFWFFPETSHPGTRGIDKLLADESSGAQSGRHFVFLNPFASLRLLRSVNLLAVTLAGFCTLLTDYVLLTPLAYTIGAKYGITNEAAIWACFIPAGLGNILGAPLAGRVSDKIVVQWRKKRGGVWVPEDRLRATLIGASILVPLSVLFSGLLTHYISTKMGLIMNLLCLFLNGLGIDIVLSPSAAYIVDVMHAKSAESMAVNSGFRSLLMALAIAGIFPMINHFGVALTNTLSALVAWVGFGILWGTIRYGDRMRAWVDVGYSTAENN